MLTGTAAGNYPCKNPFMYPSARYYTIACITNSLLLPKHVSIMRHMIPGDMYGWGKAYLAQTDAQLPIAQCSAKIRVQHLFQSGADTTHRPLVYVKSAKTLNLWCSGDLPANSPDFLL